MKYTLEEIINIFEDANQKFLDNEKKFIKSGVSERALCGRLMIWMHEAIKSQENNFDKYYVDIEHNRNNGGRIKTIKNKKEKVLNITCDLILHSRGEVLEQDNLIAFEMKKVNASKEDEDKDRERLITMTLDTFDNIWSYDGKTFPEHVCRYLLGVYYKIDSKCERISVEYYCKGEKIRCYERSF